MYAEMNAIRLQFFFKQKLPRTIRISINKWIIPIKTNPCKNDVTEMTADGLIAILWLKHISIVQLKTTTKRKKYLISNTISNCHRPKKLSISPKPKSTEIISFPYLISQFLLLLSSVFFLFPLEYNSIVSNFQSDIDGINWTNEKNKRKGNGLKKP